MKMLLNPTLILRTATIKDLQLLEHWDQQQHVIEADPDDDWDWAYELTRFPDWREQLIAEIGGRSIGCVQIIDPAQEETHYWGEISRGKRAIDIWIGQKEDLRKGYGTIIMGLAITHCFKNCHVKEILIDPLESNINAMNQSVFLGGY